MILERDRGGADEQEAGSGGGLVVGQVIVDQEVVGSNPINGRNLFLSCARSPGLLSSFRKTSTGFR